MLDIPCTLRRHSYSAPARLLDDCLAKLDILSSRVDTVLFSTGLVRSKSVPDLSCVAGGGQVAFILEEILDKIVCKMPQCHHCHRTLDHPDHRGIMPGINHCSLNHFELCPGGRSADKGWTSCPETEDDEVDKQAQAGAVDAHGLDLSGSSDSDTVTSKDNSPNPEINKNNVESLLTTKVDPSVLASLLIEAENKSRQKYLQDEIVIEDTDDEEDMHLAEEIERLRLHVEQQAKDRLKAEEKQKLEKKRLRREKLEKQRAELLDQSRILQLPLPAAPKSVLKSVPKPAAVVGEKNLKEKAAELAARQQQRDAVRNKVEGLTIAGIRALPGMTPEIENYVLRLQEAVPSLAKTPSAPSAAGVSFQPPGVLSAKTPHQDNEEFDMDFIYSTSRGKLVRVVHDSPKGGRSSLFSSSSASGKSAPVSRATPKQYDEDSFASEDEDCPVTPARGHKLVWYRDASGQKYFLHKPCKDMNTPELVKSYICDEATGRWYEKMVPKLGAEKLSIPDEQQPLPKPAYLDHRVNSLSPVPRMVQGVRTPVQSAPLPQGERVPGFLLGESEKQGKVSKMPDLVQWARNCPVNWTQKITSDKMNAVLWAWASISELLATRTGQAPTLQPGELEARMQHVCNVLEITLQASGQSDFGGDAWNVARLYDQKVQQKVDSRRFSWLQLSAMNHGASHPHELMAAHQELAKKPKVNRGGNYDGTGSKEEPRVDRKKPKCGTWNKSEVRGKCAYEVENPSEKCRYSHECTYCKSRSLKPVDHQRFFCSKRKEDER